MYGPVIKGKLVCLRPPRPTDDVAAIAAWFEDMEVTRFMKRRNPPSIEMEKEFLDHIARSPDDIWWALEHEGKLIGGTGIRGIDWRNGFGTTGTVIADRSVWGKGIARELMQLRAEYVFMQTPLRTLRSGYIEGNVASGRAQKAAGYKEVGRWHDDVFVEGKWHDHILTELRREDWERARSG